MSGTDQGAQTAGSHTKKYVVFAILLLISLAADQASKVWARGSLRPRHAPIVVVDGYFDLRYSENPGSAFGLFRGVPGARYLLLVVGVVAMGVVVSLLRKTPANKLRIAAELGLLAGGALGNIADRVARGVVTDFVVWKFKTYEWPTFNIADAALVVGILAFMLEYKEPPKPSSAPGPASDQKEKKATKRR